MTDEVARLVTVWDANFQRLDDKLTKIQRSHFKAASMIKKDADALTRRLETRYGAVGKALDNVFSDSRLAMIQAGSSRLSVFGSALEPLGPAGLVAAAGIGALAAAGHQAIEAMKFADEIDDASQKLKIGTDALQQYRFAMTEVGGEAGDADAALASFAVTLGLAQSGLSPKAMKGFKALGIDKATLGQLGHGRRGPAGDRAPGVRAGQGQRTGGRGREAGPGAHAAALARGRGPDGGSGAEGVGPRLCHGRRAGEEGRGREPAVRDHAARHRRADEERLRRAVGRSAVVHRFHR